MSEDMKPSVPAGDPNPGAPRQKGPSTLDKGAAAASKAAGVAVSAYTGSKAAGKAVEKVASSKAGSKVIKGLLVGGVVLSLIGPLSTLSVPLMVGAALSATNSDSAYAGAIADGDSSTDMCFTLSGDVKGAGSFTSADQVKNAKAIIEATMKRGLKTEDAIIAVMVAMAESSLKNIGHGDAAGPDSRGLFQQRSGWGPEADRMDPTKATNLFLNSLTDPKLYVYESSKRVNGTPTSRYSLDPWVVAQAVQRSAFSDGSNYKKYYAAARQMVAGVTSGSGACGPVSADAKGVIAEARRHLGKPYVWAASGPDSFDCSGLMMYVYAKAGIQLPRTAAQQYAWSKKFPRSQAQPGDLLFWKNNEMGVYHVAMYIGDGKMIEAPAPGLTLREVPLYGADLMSQVGRPFATK